MQPPEDLKYLVEILPFDPDPVVLNAEGPILSLLFGTNLYLRRNAASSELDGVSDEILEQLKQLRFISPQNGKVFFGDRGPAVPDGGGKVCNCILKNAVEIDRRELLPREETLE